MSATLEPADDDLVDISELPFEKQFAINAFEKEVDKMSLKQARYFLKVFRRQEELKFHVLKGVVKKDGI